MNASTILLVDDDEVLSQVLRRVLTRQGYHVVSANNAAQAEQMAKEHHPQLGLLDLCLPDGDGIDLARRLNEQSNELPLILLTAYPLRLREKPELATRFNRVLTKPVNLQELRDAIESALHEPAPAGSRPTNGTSHIAAPAEPTPSLRQDPPVSMSTVSSPETPIPEKRKPHGGWIAAAATAAAVCLLAGAAWHFQLYTAIPLFSPGKDSDGGSGEMPVRAVKDGAGADVPDAIELSDGVVKRLNITTVPVKPAKAHRPLELAGSLGVDPDQVTHVRSLFSGKIIEIGRYDTAAPEGSPRDRKLRVGDDVVKDQLLAVVWSNDYGQKKSDLIDALVMLAGQDEALKFYEALDKSGSTPPMMVLQQRIATEQARNTAQRAENALRTAGVNNAEIEQLKKQARDITKPLDRAKLVQDDNWQRLEIRANKAGTIIEKNNNPTDVIDPTVELFKIADLNRLTVWANVREEDLPFLLQKDLPIPWTVMLGNDPNGKPLPGQIEHISAGIDPTQHTALAMGYVDNPKKMMRGAQFITANVNFDDPKDTVEIPTAALVEDGRDSVVFVVLDEAKHQYAMKKVKVVKRYADVVQISNKLTKLEADAGLQTLGPDESVVTQNVLGMKAALEDLPKK
jgi:cobalt-zinc-cadmium efflux system membrane fusion protein